MFDFADVVAAICDKLVRRHPHVFGDAQGRIATPSEQTRLLGGDQARGARRRRRGAGCSTTCRSPCRGSPVRRSSASGPRRVGFDWPDAAGVRAKVDRGARRARGAAGRCGPMRATIAAEMRRPAVHDRESVPASRARSRDLRARRERRFERRFERVEAEVRGRRRLGRARSRTLWTPLAAGQGRDKRWTPQGFAAFRFDSAPRP